MKTIGLIGGMSWESTIPYYRVLNETVKARLGGLHSAKVLLHSVDFAEVEALMRQGDWDAVGETLAGAARGLEEAGADFLVICTNTMHNVAPAVEVAVGIPLLHIADCTAEEVARAGKTQVGLLGTRFTMEMDFYKERTRQRLGRDVLIPDAEGRDLVHRVIFEELCLGKVVEESRQRYREIIADLVSRGAEGIILGCTELALLVRDEDSAVPLFDTATIHARKAAEFALA